MATDLIGIIEAAYRFDVPEPDWLAGIAEGAARVFGRGLGVCGYTYSFGESAQPHIERLHCTGDFDPAWLERWYERVGQSPRGVGNAPVGWSHWLGLPCATASAVRGLRPMLGALAVFGGARDVLSINGRNPGDFGVRLGIPLPRSTSLSTEHRAIYARVAAHLAAGYRVRRSLGERRVATDAILARDGAVVHAEREAASLGALAALRRAARSLDRARSQRGRRDASAATRAWRALVDARWSLLDRFDADGKQFLVATRNDVAPDHRAALSARERQVLACAALDHTNKEIAYELGLAAPTVRVLLVRAARKLGARGRDDAIQRFRALPDAEAAPPSSRRARRRG